jgi:hypothetical protein
MVTFILHQEYGLTPSPTDPLPDTVAPRKRDAAFSANEREPRTSALLVRNDGGFSMSSTSSAIDASESLFVDPWSRAPDHQGDVPAGALFVGAWESDVFIDTYNEALFLVRGDRQDLLWSLADYAGKPISRGCVAGAPHAGTDKQAARKLLDALVRARMGYELPRRPYHSGLLTSAELADIVDLIVEEFERNARIAEAAQRADQAPIIKVATELRLNPRPAGHNDSAWIAACPSRSHWIMLSPSDNEFGCGYCRRKGGPAELKAFADDVTSQWRKG